MLSRLRKRPVQVGPAYARKPYIGSDQLAFYQRLRQALPDCTFFADIALTDLIEPLASEPRLQRRQQEKLDGVRFAYGVFNDMLELLCLIELTGPGPHSETRAQTLAILAQAGIACFSWAQNNLPTSDQILRAMSAYTDIAPSRFEPAANSVLLPGALTWENVVSAAGPASFALSVDEVQRLTPNGSVRAKYPHIWERICLFCHEPRHLEQYLSSLSLQDRSNERSGFPDSVIVELTNLQGANARFLPVPARARGGWNEAFINR